MSQLKNIYCVNCRRFLGKEDIRRGKVLFKCPNCGKLTEISVQVVVNGALDKQKGETAELG